jgi:hypothetical protein
MFLPALLVLMATVVPVDDTKASQEITISQEEMELLEQLEFLEALDVLKSPAMDQEMEDQKK